MIQILPEGLTLPSEYIAGLGLELIKMKISKKIDEKKLHSKLGLVLKIAEYCIISTKWR